MVLIHLDLYWIAFLDKVALSYFLRWIFNLSIRSVVWEQHLTAISIIE